MPAQMQKLGYIEGLKRKLREALILKDPATLQDATSFAKTLEFQLHRLTGSKDTIFGTDPQNQNKTDRNQTFNPKQDNFRPPYRHNNNNNFNPNNGPNQGPFRPDYNQRNFNTRQPFTTRPPAKNAATELENLTQQMNDMQIKMSYIDNPSDFNHFDMGYSPESLNGEDQDYPMKEDEYPYDDDYPASQASHHQILYNPEYYRPHRYANNASHYQQEAYSEEPFD